MKLFMQYIPNDSYENIDFRMQKVYVYKHNNIWKFKRSMENFTVLDHFQRINAEFTIATVVIITCLFLVLTILEAGWSAFVVTNLRKVFTKLRRIKNENDT